MGKRKKGQSENELLMPAEAHFSLPQKCGCRPFLGGDLGPRELSRCSVDSDQGWGRFGWIGFCGGHPGAFLGPLSYKERRFHLLHVGFHPPALLCPCFGLNPLLGAGHMEMKEFHPALGELTVSGGVIHKQNVASRGLAVTEDLEGSSQADSGSGARQT